MTEQLITQPSEKHKDLSEAHLRSLLDRDLANGSIVAVRSGKISRRRYADHIGCHLSALTRFSNVFSEYEKRLGVITGPLKHLVDMEKWLSVEYDAGRLMIRDGKLDRAVFASHFKLRGGAFNNRYPQIRDLFRRFDERARREGYMPVDRRAEYERFLRVLSGDLILHKDRINIELKALTEAAQIPLSRLTTTNFAEALSARQAEITARVVASKIDPFVHGRVFAFSDLSSLWPVNFLESVGTHFKILASGLAQQGMAGYYCALIDFLTWIGNSVDQNCKNVVAGAFALGRVSSVDQWEETSFLYRTYLISEKGGRSANRILRLLRTSLVSLSSSGVLPSTAVRLPGVKHMYRESGRLRSVAEAGIAAEDEDKYIAFASEQLRNSAESLALDLGRSDISDFTNGVAKEACSMRDRPSDVASAVLTVLERRLLAMRDHANAIVERAMAAYERGRVHLALADIDSAEFERVYFDEATTQLERRILVQKHFPDPSLVNSEQAATGLANFLALIDHRHKGILPSAKDDHRFTYGHFLAKRYSYYGGFPILEPMLMPTAETVGAVLVLYLCESGANLSVGRTLDRDCVEASDLDGYHRITGHKARAKGKPIVVDLPTESAAVKAISWLLKAGGRLSSAAEEDADRLLVIRIRDRVQLMSPDWFTRWFKSFVASVHHLSDLDLTPNMIRPSVLLHAALSNDGRLSVGMALGQHGLAVTQGYQQKSSTRLIYDENIRRFQTVFETLVLSSVEDAAARLGISADQFDARLGNMRKTGLGTFCKDGRGRPGAQGESCSSIDCWNNCPHLMIVAEIDSIAHLQLWQAVLRQVQPEWERDRPERWDAVWLPWLCLTDVVQEKMARGPLIKVWAQAEARAKAIAKMPGYLPPALW